MNYNPEQILTPDAKVVFRAPEGAYEDHIDSKSSLLLKIGTGLKLTTVGLAAAISYIEPSALKLLSMGATYATASVLRARIITDAKQEANDTLSPFPKQIEQVSIKNDFFKEVINPFRGVRRIFPQRQSGKNSNPQNTP